MSHQEESSQMGGCETIDQKQHKEEGHTSQTLFALEEQVRIFEATLLAQKKRRDQLLKEQEHARQQKQKKLSERAALHDRQERLLRTKTKNTALQKNLRDSLLKSRERLQKLTTLEAMIDSMEEERSQEQKAPQISSVEDESQEASTLIGKAEVRSGHLAPDLDKIDRMIDSEDKETSGSPEEQNTESFVATIECNDDGSNNDMSNSHTLVDMYRYGWLREFHSVEDDRQSPNSWTFKPFLPCLTSSQVQEYMLLSMRESNALDSINLDLGTCLRRMLFGGTCLDIRMLASESWPSADAESKDDSPGEYVQNERVHDLTQQPLVHPNLSLCPYELSGTCADDLCPYQHLSKEPKIVSRERLPLPSLHSLFSVSADVAEMSAESSSDEARRTPEQLTKPSDMKLTDNNTREESHLEEENFITLPYSYGSEIETVNDDMSIQPSSQTTIHDQLWWGGKVPHCRASTPSSVIDTFQDTFKIMVCETTNSTDRLEIMDLFSSQQEILPSNQMVQFCMNLGRVVDAVRLALHSGRYDVAFTLCKALEQEKDLSLPLRRHEKQTLCIELHKATRIRLQTLVLRAFKHQKEPSLSELENQFMIQATMAVHSSIIWKIAEALDEHSSNAANLDSSLVRPLADLLDLDLFFDSQQSTDDVRPKTFDVNVLRELLTENSSEEKPPSLCAFVIRTKLELSRLKDICTWSKRVFCSRSRGFQERSLEMCLEEYWSTVSCHLRESGKTSAGNDSHSWYLDSLVTAISLVGQSIFGCLSSLESIADCGSTVPYDSWTSFDTFLQPMLQELLKDAKAIPMAMLMLCPICAATVTIQTALSNYTTAQQRLENFLCSSCHKDRESATFLQFSELLWSQLVQLRMILPNEATVIEASASTSTTMQPLWEPSVSVKQGMKQLADRVGSLGIRLHSLGLWGDESLSRDAQQNPNTMTGSTMFLYLASTDYRLSKKSTPSRQNRCVSGDVDSFQSKRLSFNLYESLLPPLHLLYTGHQLTKLNLSHSCLIGLPNSFAYCFPNLESLNLSHNQLVKLPESFRRCLTRMRTLKLLLLQYNSLEFLPGDIFSFWGATVNSNSSSLQVLNISHNKLKKVPHMNATVFSCLEELYLDHNELAQTSMVELSHLVLKISTLRSLSLEHQRVDGNRSHD